MNIFNSAMSGAMGEPDPWDNQQSTYQLYGVIKRHTEKAVLFELDGVEHWFPLSHANYLGQDDRGYAVLQVSAWIAKEKGLL